MKNAVNAGAMGRKLINYLPYQIREFQEYKGITIGEQPEFELTWNYYQDVFDNQFIDTAGDYGLSRWEKMLHITPKATDSLEIRRIRIKARLNNFTPYTMRWLKRWLDGLCGPGNHTETVTDYTPSIRLNCAAISDVNKIAEIIRDALEEIIPENLGWGFRFWLDLQAHACAGGGLAGSREEVRVTVAMPRPLTKPGGLAAAHTCAGCTGTVQRIAVAVAAPKLTRPAGLAHTAVGAGLAHTYQRMGVRVRNPFTSI